MKNLLTLILPLLFLANVPIFQEAPRDIPDALKASPDERVVLQAHASGFQVYTCQASASQKYEWALKGPEADLLDAKGTAIGKHYAGPTWKINDGSEVTGKLAAKKDAPDANAVP